MNAISLTWQPEGAFQHVGFVVASIANSVQGFASMLQADWDKQVFHDRAVVALLEKLQSAAR